MVLIPGSQLGPYRIIEQIGRGGMATVYKAFQPSLSRYVAIKVLPDFFGQDPAFLQRFHQEARVVASLRHPNLLVIHDYGEESAIAYIVYEYVEGGTLKDRLGSPLSPSETVFLLRPVAAALDYAHARGILHRDVKPSNILITRDGTSVLGDFGLARMLEGASQLTLTGTTVGTPEYMAPEQATNGEVGLQTDIYSLGVIAYEMLTGQVPYLADTPLAVLLAHLNNTLPLPRSRNPQLSEAVESVLLKALAKEPAARFQSATEMLSALENALRPTIGLQLGLPNTEYRRKRGPARGLARYAIAIVAPLVAASILAAAVIGFNATRPERAKQASQIEERSAEQSTTVAVSATTEPMPVEARLAASVEPDRQSCSSIFGTDYRSATEEEWYRANCVSKPSAKPTPLASGTTLPSTTAPASQAATSQGTPPPPASATAPAPPAAPTLMPAANPVLTGPDRFLGCWHGTWIGGQLDSMLDIRTVSASQASAIYTFVGHASSMPLQVQSDGRLTYSLGGIDFVWSLSSDGSRLYGTARRMGSPPGWLL